MQDPRSPKLATKDAAEPPKPMELPASGAAVAITANAHKPNCPPVAPNTSTQNTIVDFQPSLSPASVAAPTNAVKSSRTKQTNRTLIAAHLKAKLPFLSIGSAVLCVNAVCGNPDNQAGAAAKEPELKARTFPDHFRALMGEIKWLKAEAITQQYADALEKALKSNAVGEEANILRMVDLAAAEVEAYVRFAKSTPTKKQAPVSAYDGSIHRMGANDQNSGIARNKDVAVATNLAVTGNPAPPTSTGKLESEPQPKLIAADATPHKPLPAGTASLLKKSSPQGGAVPLPASRATVNMRRSKAGIMSQVKKATLTSVAPSPVSPPRDPRLQTSAAEPVVVSSLQKASAAPAAAPTSISPSEPIIAGAALRQAHVQAHAIAAKPQTKKVTFSDIFSTNNDEPVAKKVVLEAAAVGALASAPVPIPGVPSESPTKAYLYRMKCERETIKKSEEEYILAQRELEELESKAKALKAEQEQRDAKIRAAKQANEEKAKRYKAALERKLAEGKAQLRQDAAVLQAAYERVKAGKKRKSEYEACLAELE